VAAGELAAARVSLLEQALAAEQERTKGLSARFSGMEYTAQQVKEVETLLQAERDRNNLLTKRITETEQSAEQASKRFEEMAKKLGEIAVLASQLGAGKRQP
jgi:hypothetical protein